MADREWNGSAVISASNAGCELEWRMRRLGPRRHAVATTRASRQSRNEAGRQEQAGSSGEAELRRVQGDRVSMTMRADEGPSTGCSS